MIGKSEDERAADTTHRPTGPEIRFADPCSKGGLSVRETVRDRITARRIAWHRVAAAAAVAAVVVAVFIWALSHLTIEYPIEATSSSVGPFTVDANGWTVIEPITKTTGTCTAGTSDGSCLLYVSGAGTDDATNCKGYDPPVTSTPATTCKTGSYALTKIRTTKPDWVLFKRGETFNEGTSSTNLSITLGVSAARPFVMTAYPRDPVTYDDRPIINNSGTFLQHQGNGTFRGAFISLVFTNTFYDPNSVNYWSSPGSSIGAPLVIIERFREFFLLEDSAFYYRGYGVQLQTADRLATGSDYLRRNVFYNDGKPGLPLLSSKYSSLTIEENLFYKGYTMRTAAPASVTINVASPAVITYANDSTVAPENGGIPIGSHPLVALLGPVPTGLTAATNNCDTANRCYYLCNISGATANLSRNSNCSPLINTTAAACNAGCTSLWSDMTADALSHNVYLDVGWDQDPTLVSGPAIFRNNITAYASGTGAQIRPGGTYYNNLFVKNPIQTTGVQWPSEYSYNVALQAKNMTKAVADSPFGWGFEISSYRCAAPALGPCTQAMVDSPPNSGASGTTVHHNILAKSETSSGNGSGITLHPYGSFVNSVVSKIEAVTNTILESNIICDWQTSGNKPYDDQGTGNTLSATNKPNPQTSNVDTTCAALGISSPATVGNYYEYIGGTLGSTTDDFLNAALAKWTKISWDDRYSSARVNDYIRQSYGMTNPNNRNRVRLTVTP